MKLFGKKPSAYILKMRDHPDMSTLVLENSNNPKAYGETIYFPFESQKDIKMALDLLKDAGVKTEEFVEVSVQ